MRPRAALRRISVEDGGIFSGSTRDRGSSEAAAMRKKVPALPCADTSRFSALSSRAEPLAIENTLQVENRAVLTSGQQVVCSSLGASLALRVARSIDRRRLSPMPSCSRHMFSGRRSTGCDQVPRGRKLQQHMSADVAALDRNRRAVRPRSRPRDALSHCSSLGQFAGSLS